MINQIIYPEPIEAAIAQLESWWQTLGDRYLFYNYSLSPRSLALLLLQKDPGLWETMQRDQEQCRHLEVLITVTQNQLKQPIGLAIANTRQSQARTIERVVLQETRKRRSPLGETLHQLTVNPITGFPILVFILYYGVYKFVGEFGAGELVDRIETFFELQINPFVNQITTQVIPWKSIQDLIANDYGIITLGIRYATAIVLPVVATYFLMFSLLEDSGYLPRLSLMLDRLFKSVGLSGRAVIPMVLGLGCDTMATIVTRTLETKRERLIATFLLSLAIPCAAQWGVIVGLLAQKPAGLLFWGGFISAIFIIVGYLTAKLLPGDSGRFYMEVPPLRLPKLRNVITKTWVRMKWYFIEVLPLFIWASVLIWAGRLTGLFDMIIRLIEPIVSALGMPAQAAPIFLYGFFRRDYGAAGLFDLQQQGSLTGNQLVVAAIVLTLFLPCIAQLQMLIKERGAKTTTAIVLFIFPFAFLMGYLVNLGLTAFGVQF
ncbi:MULTISPECIES: ferrous iron transporter B [Calothrix]|uniref:Ferrous iron transporter B n=2 Tax=Calothrix TaxID=1186 RepID=A0ABR8AGK5_9CYAN|nr:MULTISPECIES: ferrous iron transporter B [Calothrix]MBD2199064.1 ferrous iron transporter B [Calothrix parietina FACHB-288]MBD2227766.1 ferrous iron transporter B [Calothrix anomala FACHB-343]